MSRAYMTHTKQCVHCGEIIQGCGGRRKYCATCADEIVRTRNRLDMHARYHGLKKPKKPLGLEKTVKAAARAGMSYGMYQAMLYAQEVAHEP